MLPPKDTISSLGGIARGTRLQQFGISRQTLANHVNAGAIVRLRPGVFAVPPVAPPLREAIAHGGALTCASVLRAHGVWVLPPADGLHVWLAPGQHALSHRDCTCTSHYYSGDPPLGEASIEIALVHLYKCAGAEAFFAAFESAWNLGMLSTRTRMRVRAALPNRSRWLVDLAQPDADSGLESLLRLRLHLLGIRLDCQVTIHGVGSVDFVIAERLIIEADGKGNHEGELRHKDLVRDAAASRLGYETLRFDYAQIVHDWATVQAAILGALDRLEVPL
jgi:very-short-patch-repair endonuclease